MANFDMGTLRGTIAFSADAKFGAASLSGGIAHNGTADAFLSSTFANGGTLTTGTIQAWVKAPSTTTARVAAARQNWWTVGCAANGTAVATYNSPGSVTVSLTSTVNICNGAWHHVALEFVDGKGTFFVDGVKVSTSTVVGQAGTSPGGLTVGGLHASALSGQDWAGIGGLVDSVTLSAWPRYGGVSFPVPTVDDMGDGSNSHFTFEQSSLADRNWIYPTHSGLSYSPHNWDVGPVIARSNCAGAYFRTILFNGVPDFVTLNFNPGENVGDKPKIAWRFDGNAWETAKPDWSVPIAVPALLNGWKTHTLEVVVDATNETANRWTNQTGTRFTGISTSSWVMAAAPPARRELHGLIFGDSITEGVAAINSTSGAAVDRNTAKFAWPYVLGDQVGAEIGVVGFSGAAITSASGVGSIPKLRTFLNAQWSGGPNRRIVEDPPDFILTMIGHNDGTANTVTEFTACLDDLLSWTPVSTKIVVVRPLSGRQAANLQAAIAACSTPKRCTYVDTEGWFGTTNSADGVHPYGSESGFISSALASRIREAISRGGNYINVGGVPKPLTAARR